MTEKVTAKQKEFMATKRKTAIIAAAFAIINEVEAQTWDEWILENNLGIPYALGIETNDIKEEGLTESGWEQIETTYDSLCNELGVEKIETVNDLMEIIFEDEDEA
jgi:hypothetical protein